MGVKNAILIGFVAGLLNVIPYIGPIIGAMLGIIIAITTNIHFDEFSGILPLIGKMVIVYAIAQVLDNVVLQPLIYSQSVNAHPLEIFLVILIAGSVGGIAGMVLAVPTYSIFRVFAREFFIEFKVVQKLTENI